MKFMVFYYLKIRSSDVLEMMERGDVLVLYKPVERKKVYEEVADTILHMIKEGQLKPGDKLDSVVQLAESFAVSRSVIREALSGLRAMGLLVMRQGEGTFISQFDASIFYLPVTTAFLMKKEHVKELFEVRKILESGAARSAALNRQQTNLEEMEKIINEMKTAHMDSESGEKVDMRFHLAMVKASHNDILINLMSSVSELMAETIQETRKLYYAMKGREETLIRDHELIYQAVKAKDQNQAEKHLLDHLVGVEDLLRKYVY